MNSFQIRIGVAALALASLLGLAISQAGAAGRRDGGDARPIQRDFRGVVDEGRLPGGHIMTVSVWLRYQHESELAQLLALQSTPGTAYYHRYLSLWQWNSYFAPAWTTVSQTVASLNSRGLRVIYVAPNRNLVVAAGPAAAVERAFSTELHAVLQPGHGTRISNVRPAFVPREIAPAVVSVTGLDTIERMHTHNLRVGQVQQAQPPLPRAQPVITQPLPRAPQALPIRLQPAVYSTSLPTPGPDPTLAPGHTNGGGNGYCPDIIANAYHAPVQHGFGGTGYNVATVLDTHTFNSELQAYYTDCSFASPGPSAPTRKYTKPGPCATTTVPAESLNGACENAASAGNRGSNPDSLEANLDAASIRGMAPWSNFYEYVMPDLGNDSIAQAWNLVITDGFAKTVNMSVGGCEADDPNFEFLTDYVAKQGAAQGVTYTTSSGDNGSFGCNTAGVPNGSLGNALGVDAPASGLFVVSAGGTHITTNPMAPFALATEMVWNRAGGGVSSVYSEPSWQMPLNAGNLGINPRARNVPDVSLPADPGFGGIQQCAGLVCQAVGGTSESSPLWTGMLITIEQACAKTAGLGDVHAFLYALFAGDQSHGDNHFHFRDITTGNNGTVMFYSAVAGYDDASGMGAPLGFEIAGTGC